MVNKKYKIIFEKNVKYDLKEIVDFIKTKSPANALMVKKTILEKIKTLSTFPYKHHADFFHPLCHTTDKYRLLVVWSYNIHYKVEENTIIILKIIFGGKDPDSITNDLNDL